MFIKSIFQETEKAFVWIMKIYFLPSMHTERRYRYDYTKTSSLFNPKILP